VNVADFLFSVVIPAHNEADNLPATVAGLQRELRAAGVDYEIVVVNDHSSDDTERVMGELAAADPRCRLVRNEASGGYGMAVRCGMDHFRGDGVAVVMADASDDPVNVGQYAAILREGYDCAFGSRFIRGSRVVDYPVHKLWLNRLVNFCVRVLFWIPYNDVTNTFKAYRRTTIDGVRPLISKHFNLTVELPLKAIVRGYRYKIIPIHWYGRQKGVSKLKIKEMGSRYLFVILYVWLEKLLSRGDYRRLKGDAS